MVLGVRFGKVAQGVQRHAMPCAYLHPAQGVAQPQSLAGCVMDVRAAGAPRGDQVVVQLWGGPWWCTLLGEGHGGALFLGRAMGEDLGGGPRGLSIPGPFCTNEWVAALLGRLGHRCEWV